MNNGVMFSGKEEVQSLKALSQDLIFATCSHGMPACCVAQVLKTRWNSDRSVCGCAECIVFLFIFLDTPRKEDGESL